MMGLRIKCAMIQYLELVGKGFLIAFCSDKGKEVTLLLIFDGHTVLDLKFYRLDEPPGCRYSIDCTDQLSFHWELKLSSNNGLYSNLTRPRGSTLRHLHPKAVILPLQQLRSLSSNTEQFLTTNMDSMQMLCKGNINIPLKEK